MQPIENSALYCQPGSAPVRVVIGKVEGQYCTCLEVLMPDHAPFLCHMLRVDTFDQALADYQRRIEWLIGKPRKGV